MAPTFKVYSWEPDLDADNLDDERRKGGVARSMAFCPTPCYDYEGLDAHLASLCADNPSWLDGSSRERPSISEVKLLTNIENKLSWSELLHYVRFDIPCPIPVDPLAKFGMRCFLGGSLEVYTFSVTRGSELRWDRWLFFLPLNYNEKVEKSSWWLSLWWWLLCESSSSLMLIPLSPATWIEWRKKKLKFLKLL